MDPPLLPQALNVSNESTNAAAAMFDPPERP
jgi:hypothetical protein